MPEEKTFQFTNVQENVPAPPGATGRFVQVVEVMLSLPAEQWHRMQVADKKAIGALRGHLTGRRCRQLQARFKFRTITDDGTWLYWNWSPATSAHGQKPKEVTGKKKE